MPGSVARRPESKPKPQSTDFTRVWPLAHTVWNLNVPPTLLNDPEENDHIPASRAVSKTGASAKPSERNRKRETNMPSRKQEEVQEEKIIDLKEGDCGATVDAITSAGGRGFAAGADVSDAAQVAAAVEAIASELGPPTVLVNNAGVIRDNLLFKMTDDDWDTVLGVHLRGSFLMTRACQKYMVDAEWGRVINLSSSSALGNRGQANYSAAKAGMQGFTKTLAIELGKFGITANAIAPGLVETRFAAALFQDKQAYEALMAHTPLRRHGQPIDIAGAAVFLASEASSYMTGQTLLIDGGGR